MLPLTANENVNWEHDNAGKEGAQNLEVSALIHASCVARPVVIDFADEPQDPVVAQSAFMLYGMIHARFIVTARGLEAMVRTC